MLSYPDPTISVVMSVYNAEQTLADSINSIINQTYQNFEFIIIDDGSTDTSLEIITSFSMKDDRIHLIINERNLGVAASLNKGIKVARGKFIARMDADDISLPKRFESQISFLENHTEVGVLGTAINEKLLSHRGESRVRSFEQNNDQIQWRLLFRCALFHPTVMARRHLFNENLYNPDYLVAQDYDLWTRLAPITEFANLPTPLLDLHIHQTSSSIIHKSLQKSNSTKIQEGYMATYLGRTTSIKKG